MENKTFKKIELSGYTKQEALENSPLSIIRDATQAWKKEGSPISEGALNDFCKDYLKKHTKFAPGVGCSITMIPGSPDTRERPYEWSNVVNEKGGRKWKTFIELIDPETNTVLGAIDGTKGDAVKLAKSLYTKKGYKGSVIAKYVKKPVEGEPVAFKVKYAPSKSSKVGKYFVFGVER